MGREFSIQRGAVRVVFGVGVADRVLASVTAAGFEHVLVACTPSRKSDAIALAERLGTRAVGVVAIAREHTPRETVEEARREAERTNADAMLALGGGSALGLAKAVAVESRVKVVAIPTTYSGSEMTPIYGISQSGEKKTGRDERARPVLVIYDPALTYALPRAITVTSLWNAMAHACETLWSPVDRATMLAAEEALRMTSASVARLAANADDHEARELALEGAYLAGAVFADAGSGMHHKLCHMLGGMFGLPHSATHAVLLPHTVRAHRESSPDAMSAMARALGVVDPVLALERLARATGIPSGLDKLGMPRDGIARVDASVRAIVEAAWGSPAPSPSAPALRGPEVIASQPGLGSTHESEALDGALPRNQNTPLPPPYGLYPELLNGTPFTVRSDENSRVWMYRVRPSFSHAPFAPLAAGKFCAPFGEVDPNRVRWRPLPIPSASESIDFVDGLVTLGGAGNTDATGPGFAVHLYAANADMSDRAFSNADGDMLIVPQEGTLECRTELGWLRVAPGSVLLVPRAIKFAIGVPAARAALAPGGARGWVLEVIGRRLRLPERGPIGSNGLADARHFRAPVASYEDRTCPSGFQVVHKTGGRLHASTQSHSPFDVVAWHGNHAPCTYDLSLFNAMGSVTFDHPDPSILTVLTAPLDDHGRAIADFVVFPPRWEVSEHSFRPPFMHRNAASEVNIVVRTPAPHGGYEAGCTFVSPLLTSHGVSTKSYDGVLDGSPTPGPNRIPDDSLWAMFESSFPFRATAWARSTPLVDDTFADLFEGMRSRFEFTSKRS